MNGQEEPNPWADSLVELQSQALSLVGMIERGEPVDSILTHVALINGTSGDVLSESDDYQLREMRKPLTEEEAAILIRQGEELDSMTNDDANTRFVLTKILENTRKRLAKPEPDYFKIRIGIEAFTDYKNLMEV